ncbi:unnamed protein product [Angiostrongylus costaricensis]|uniref:AMP-binding domain-containing protein n=1 Tax=Angiostrongylus costaricensis TaxID=334426 RepID=A0A0R3PUZ7_ANGCS|nr:unnamed protein product [Angiostrongylus costaricensis]
MGAAEKVTLCRIRLSMNSPYTKTWAHQRLSERSSRIWVTPLVGGHCGYYQISAEDPLVRISFKEVYDQSHRVASFLSQRGYAHEDVCCQVLPNCFHYAVFYLGALLAGGVMSGASALSTEYELKRQFLDSCCKVVITNYANVNKVLLAVKECPKVERKKNVIFYPDDTALLPYSSGTTGMQKGVMLSHKNFSTMLDIFNKHCEDHVLWKLGESGWDYHKENLLLMLPFYHIYGFGMMNHVLCNGSTGIVLSKFDPVVFLEAIQTYKPKMIMVVPPILLFLTKHPMTAKYDLSSVHFVFSGAAPLGKDLCDEFLRKYKHVRYLAQGYGMTECSMASHLPPLDSRMNFNNIGMLASTYEQKIVSKTGEALPIGEPGELCIRGPTIMKGYLGSPEETAQAVDNEGWLHTGDFGFMDDKGQMHILDRVKELIKVKGLQDKYESVVLFKIRHCVLGKVSPHKFLTGGVVFISEIPKSPSGKIIRRILRDQGAKDMSSKPQ